MPADGNVSFAVLITLPKRNNSIIALGAGLTPAGKEFDICVAVLKNKYSASGSRSGWPIMVPSIA
jgi:hypothetical protein